MQSVLIVDDSPDIHALLRVRLASEGLVLRHANDAASGFASAAADPPDLLLLDIDLPDRSGFDLCLELKGDPRTAAVPIVFLTGADDVVLKVRGLDLGAVDYVTKPFYAAELLARVRAALRTKRYQDLLATRARVDALTGIWNRGYFEQRIAEEVAAARRYGRIVTLVLFDLDRFKAINDTLGHPVGDRVLQSVGEVLNRTSRATDAACRLGGDEFAVITPDTPLLDGRRFAERVRAEFSKVRITGETVGVTASFGVASTQEFADRDQLSPQALIGRADEALYQAKRAGRDRVEVAAAPLRATE